MIENNPVEGSEVTPLFEIGIEQNLFAADGGIEGTDELHQNDDTQSIRRMIQGNSSDHIPSLRGVDALKAKSTISEFNDIICNIRVEHLDELKNLLRPGARLVCDIIGVIANKKNLKNHTGKGELKMILQDSGKI